MTELYARLDLRVSDISCCYEMWGYPPGLSPEMQAGRQT
jgi:hypothetical protein